MDEDGKPLTVRRALRAAEFWLLLVAAIAAVFRVPWWVTVPLVMGGLSISSLPKYVELGFGTERENLAGDAKGTGASGSHREAESTDASERGGLPRSSNEGPVMGLERRGWVIAADLGQLVRREEPFVQWKAAAFARWHEPDDARVSCPDL